MLARCAHLYKGSNGQKVGRTLEGDEVGQERETNALASCIHIEDAGTKPLTLVHGQFEVYVRQVLQVKKMVRPSGSYVCCGVERKGCDLQHLQSLPTLAISLLRPAASS